MPNFDINVRIVDGNAIGSIRQVRSELDKTEKSATSVRSALKGMFAGIGAAVLVREFIGLSNASASIENRLKLVESTVGDTEVAFQRLRDISNSTRSPLEENVALFQRVAQAQQELGASSEDLYNFVQATGTALAIQGGAANTARGALIQLSQSIGATVVRAEEFNSILEGALPLAQAAARGIDEAGGSVSKLRQLVIEGEISSKEFFQAIVSEQAALAELFATTTPTISQAFTVLRNEAVATFREFDAASGITGTLANGLLLIGQNLELIARVFVAGAITAGLIVLPGIIAAVTTSVLALTAALLLNPFVLVGVAIAAAIGYLIAFGDQISLFGKGAGTVLDFVIVAFQELGGWIRDVFGGAWTFIKTNFFDKIEAISFAEFVQNVAFVIDSVQAIFAGGAAVAAAVWQNAALVIRTALVEAFIAAAKPMEMLINGAIRGINALGGSIDEIDISGKIRESLGSDPGEVGRIVGTAFTEGFSKSMDEGNAQMKATEMLGASVTRAQVRAEDAAMAVSTVAAGSTEAIGGLNTELGDTAGKADKAGKGAKGASKSFAELYGEMEKSAEALERLGVAGDIYEEQQRVAKAIGRDLTASENMLIGAMVKKLEVLETAKGIYDDLNDSTREYMNTTQALQQLLASGAINESQAAEALNNTSMATDVAGVNSSLGGVSAYEQQLEDARNYTIERTNILTAARDADYLGEQEYAAKMVSLAAETRRQIVEIEAARWEMGISSAQASIGSVMSLIEEQGDKQSAAYKTMFKVQKALAIAEATVNTARAVSNALAAPYPPPIPQALAAAAAVAGGAEIAAIMSTTMATGLKDGGRVTGPGGPRDDRAGLYALSNGEMVINAAATAANLPLLMAINKGNSIRGMLADGGMINNAKPSLLRSTGASDAANVSRTKAPAQSQGTAGSTEPPKVNVINVQSKEAALAALSTAEGAQAIINMMSENRQSFNSALGT